MASPNSIHPRSYAAEYLPTSPMWTLSSKKAPCSCAEHGPLAAQEHKPVCEPHGSFGLHKLAVPRMASTIAAEKDQFSLDSRTYSSSAARIQVGSAGEGKIGYGSGFDVAFYLRSRWQL